MYVWVVKSRGHKVIWLNFNEAFADFKELTGMRFIYLKLMAPVKFESLKEFDGY